MTAPFRNKVYREMGGTGLEFALKCVQMFKYEQKYENRVTCGTIISPHFGDISFLYSSCHLCVGGMSAVLLLSSTSNMKE